MTTYRTCIGCANSLTDCATLAAVRKQTAGLGITSMKWRCKDRAPRFQPGDAVWARTTPVFGWEIMEDFPATFISAAGSRALVKIEAGAPARNADYEFEPKNGGGGYCRLPLSRLSERDGERQTVCKHCQDVGGHHADYCALNADMAA